MRTVFAPAIGFAAALISAACGGGTLQGSVDKLGATGISSIEFSGSGRWYQFGQAASPKLDWPEFTVSSYTATIDYGTPAAHVRMTRIQTISPSRVRPAPVEQKPDQYVSAASAWNLAVPAGAPADAAPAPQAQPAAVEERLMEIWSTPQGFLKAALANNASSTPHEKEKAVEVSFTPKGLATYTGWINRDNELQRVRTIIDNPVLGDTKVETTFSDYRDFNGIRFPATIVRTQGGHPVLELTVTAVKANAPATLPVPAEATAAPAPVTVTMERLADGVYYVKGGTHHSVAIAQSDHIVVVEAPQNEARSLAVIAKIKETIPKKPIRYVINTHHHFDHSGGLRTYVDEGAIVVTHEMNKAYYEMAWAAPRTINPDRLAQSHKTARFETFTKGHLLDAGARPIEVHHIERNGHHDAFAMVYLPREGILIEGDAYTPLAAGAPSPAAPNPYSVNLLENIQRLKLNVRQIAALHGPRLTTMDDLRAVASSPSARR
jgi:glyoxylase-like metal-dependent hydrolase (beta-lactamase superfamily II)